ESILIFQNLATPVPAGKEKNYNSDTDETRLITILIYLPTELDMQSSVEIDINTTEIEQFFGGILYMLTISSAWIADVAFQICMEHKRKTSNQPLRDKHLNISQFRYRLTHFQQLEHLQMAKCAYINYEESWYWSKTKKNTKLAVKIGVIEPRQLSDTTCERDQYIYQSK
ncbi:hypothetical protein ACJX0J_013770, partial [Zea mays]